MPSRVSVVLMTAFALSCFGILVYLWQSFGGSLPLEPRGYRVEVDFDEATQLADNADVRIAGVPVGRVVATELAGDRTRATLEVAERFAPIPRDTRAILRRKSLLGETFVELTPGTRAAGRLADGGRLTRANVADTVELDEILRVFDPETRDALGRWVAGEAQALAGRGEDLNDALGALPGFVGETTGLLALLDHQRPAIERLLRDGATVFQALGRRQGELSELVTDLDRVLATTARADDELAAGVALLPETLRELRPVARSLEALAREGEPVVRALAPAGRALPGAVDATATVAPELERLFGDLDPLLATAPAALPAGTRLLTAARPLVGRTDLLLRELVPIVSYLGPYRQELVTSWAQIAALSQGFDRPFPGGPRLHYLRLLAPLGSEALVASSARLGSNRHNPYPAPRWLDRLGDGLEAFSCANTANPRVDAAPPCRTQAPPRIPGTEPGAYPHVVRDP